MKIPLELASYNGSSHIHTFMNSSYIKYGHWSGEESEKEYNGQEYDIIFMDEATQFTERAFRFLGGCLRGASNYRKRMYLTCNPGGVGHFWVKRLFVEGKYKRDPDPEKDENPDDYKFIFATAEDNVEMLKATPNYLKILSQMPNAEAYRYGDWDSLGGNYFQDFREELHCHKSFRIPSFWTKYRSFDYGLDMFACFWWAIDEDNRAWCIRSYEKSNLNVSDAAARCLENTLPNEDILITYAPPDMWNRQKDTGRTMAEIFMTSGLPIVKADNNRVQGHMIMRQLMMPIPLNDPTVIEAYGGKDKAPKELPALMFFDDVGGVIEDIKSIQSDETNPNDCAKDPHDITHTVDGVRYFCINRSIPATQEEIQHKLREEEEEEYEEYDDYVLGGEVSLSYLNY